ncbi:unnamed protein product [Dracunculus medinensis]|uniref:Uncharacterized protein n=1 Tax=Dracunculus medinensis TaxID=318479 RepID=A0A0N4UHB3_DRAME|nr:unnamed protein product [Dracunculus medinensis]
MSERSNKITTISEEEFFRLQEQLIDLRNKNYELIEENQRQRNCINSFASKGNETFLFASKLIGRRNDKLENDKYEEEIFTLRKKLSLQEEEFRLQQTTLLSELNKVMKRCEMLESKLKEFDIADERIHSDTVAEMNREIADLKAMIAEKDMLIEEIALLKKDLLHSKSVQDDKIIQLEQSLSNTQNLLINERNLNQILNEKVVSISEEINNLRRISEKSEISEQNGDIEMRFDRKDQSSQSEEVIILPKIQSKFNDLIK